MSYSTLICFLIQLFKLHQMAISVSLITYREAQKGALVSPQLKILYILRKSQHRVGIVC